MSTTSGGSDPGTTDPEAGSVVPPYDDRRQSADVDTDDEKLYRDGVNVSAATGPVETDDTMHSPEPADTARGAAASPADEKPAEETPSGDSGPAATGPAHYEGTTRGEHVSDDSHDQGGPEKASGTGDGQ
ncbi:MAG: hypothetical protein AVDCRST_MAG21-1601 [uncultured Nocardioidaceae bacterium]|uniref:Uncharacterized protein n=1 Tax=uncultured Nocardioidaceae bacterium TaxID=253824 RepID=A0A6J4N7P3_9ACTN|nr:MAG: hypothetical protein AVDCRST_MAG21-1601 [uncultured Nocardioidaceae bacterium]